MDKCFSGTHEVWMKFLSKETSASKLLIQGKVSFKGNKMVLLQYGPKFEFLPDIASKI
jgi:putative sterol carrier protein